METEQLEGLLNSHQLFCHGADKEGAPAFSEGETEPVIVKVYRNGVTIPLCRYLEFGCVAPRCNPELKEGVQMYFAEDELGVCPYATKR